MQSPSRNPFYNHGMPSQALGNPFIRRQSNHRVPSESQETRSLHQTPAQSLGKLQIKRRTSLMTPSLTRALFQLRLYPITWCLPDRWAFLYQETIQPLNQILTLGELPISIRDVLSILYSVLRMQYPVLCSLHIVSRTSSVLSTLCSVLRMLYPVLCCLHNVSRTSSVLSTLYSVLRTPYAVPCAL